MVVSPLLIFLASMAASACLVLAVAGLTAACVAIFLDGDWHRLDAVLADAYE